MNAAQEEATRRFGSAYSRDVTGDGPVEWAAAVAKKSIMPELLVHAAVHTVTDLTQVGASLVSGSATEVAQAFMHATSDFFSLIEVGAAVGWCNGVRNICACQ